MSENSPDDKPKKGEKSSRPARKRVKSQIETAVSEVETFLSAVTHAAGMEYDRRRISEIIQPIIESILPHVAHSMLVEKLGLSADAQKRIADSEDHLLEDD